MVSGEIRAGPTNLTRRISHGEWSVKSRSIREGRNTGPNRWSREPAKENHGSTLLFAARYRVRTLFTLIGVAWTCICWSSEWTRHQTEHTLAGHCHSRQVQTTPLGQPQRPEQADRWENRNRNDVAGPIRRRLDKRVANFYDG